MPSRKPVPTGNVQDELNWLWLSIVVHLPRPISATKHFFNYLESVSGILDIRHETQHLQI